MSILDKLQLRKTGERRPDEFQPIDGDITCEETDFPAIRDQEEYRLTLRLSTRFYANPAQLDIAKRDAERLLLHELYADVIGRARALRVAINDGNRVAALREAAKLESVLFNKIEE